MGKDGGRLSGVRTRAIIGKWHHSPEELALIESLAVTGDHWVPDRPPDETSTHDEWETVDGHPITDPEIIARLEQQHAEDVGTGRIQL